MIRFLFSLLITMVCTTTGCVSDDEPKGDSLVAGDYLPEFAVVMNDGQTISTSLLRGKVPVIVFFNTDCSDCRKELPEVQKLWDLYHDSEEVNIIPIAREETEEEIIQYWEENGLTMWFSPQTDRSVYNLFAPSIIPRIYIANQSGEIIASYDDSVMPTFEELNEKIKSLL